MLTCKKVSAGSLLTILPMALTAQTPRQDAESIQEIIVTATKSSLQDVPFSIAGRHGRADSQFRRDRYCRACAQHPGSHDHGSRAGSEPGLDPRDQRRAGGARSTGREGTSRRVSRRVADLDRAVHAGSRPLRSAALRDSARPAGHAVRRRLARGHAALDHGPAAARDLRRYGRAQCVRRHRDRFRGQRQRRPERAVRRCGGDAHRRLL